MQERDAQLRIAAELAEAGVAVITLPQTNLYLQGRSHPVATPRGLTALRPLLDAGVTVAAGGDNLQDPFNLVGRGDPLEAASLLVAAGHLLPEEALAAVSGSARAAMGLAGRRRGARLAGRARGHPGIVGPRGHRDGLARADRLPSRGGRRTVHDGGQSMMTRSMMEGVETQPSQTSHTRDSTGLLASPRSP